MIVINGPKIDKKITVACSGGVDSMAIADFLSRKHDVTIAYFHHGETENSVYTEKCLDLVKKFCHDKKLQLTVGYNNIHIKPKGKSLEEFWRDQRYKFFHSLEGKVVTAHHLQDCVETWVWSSMHGEGKIIPYSNKNVIRPFMTTKKEEFVNWCERRNIQWIEDETNSTDMTKTRNYIRNVMMPHVLKVNPGIHKVVMKKVIASNE